MTEPNVPTTSSRARRWPRAARLAVLVLAVLLGVAAAPGPARAEGPLPPRTQLQLTGHGWGHGHGMSQYGAQGAALQGKSWRQIVRFYYPGTSFGTRAGHMRVKLTDDTTPNVIVVSRPGLRLQQVPAGKRWDLRALRPRGERFRITPLDARTSRLDVHRDGTWRPVLRARGTLEFKAGGGAPLQVAFPDGDLETYRGSVRAAVPAGARTERDTVNVVSLERYLRGVVPHEVPASWRPAALRAQAVAARSYAAHQRRFDPHGHFDVYDTTSDQVYGGRSAEHPRTDEAIAGTRGVVVLHRGEPAFTQFSSSMGGFTLAGSRPYLVSRADPYEKHSGNPNMTWRRTLTVADLQRAYPGAGRVNAVSLTKEPGTGGRYVRTVRIDGTQRDVTVSGWDFRNRFGLKSSWFSIRTVTS